MTKMTCRVIGTEKGMVIADFHQPQAGSTCWTNTLRRMQATTLVLSLEAFLSLSKDEHCNVTSAFVSTQALHILR